MVVRHVHSATRLSPSTGLYVADSHRPENAASPDYVRQYPGPRPTIENFPVRGLSDYGCLYTDRWKQIHWHGLLGAPPQDNRIKAITRVGERVVFRLFERRRKWLVKDRHRGTSDTFPYTAIRRIYTGGSITRPQWDRQEYTRPYACSDPDDEPNGPALASWVLLLQRAPRRTYPAYFRGVAC